MTSQHSVEDLVARYLEDIEAFAAGAVDEACRDHPRDAEQIRRKIAASRAAGLFGAAPPGAETARSEAAPEPSSDGPGPYEPLGPYRPLKELGRGGQAVVYLAEDTRLHRQVALKVLTGLGPGSEDVGPALPARGGGRVEARASRHLRGARRGRRERASLHRDALRRGRDARGEDRGGDASQATQPGRVGVTTLRGAWRADDSPLRSPTTTTQEIPDDPRVVREGGARAARRARGRASSTATSSPATSWSRRTGQPVILDFGLARAEDVELRHAHADRRRVRHARLHVPRADLGQRVRLDRRTDVYSLGVTLYECLTLRRPFEAPTREGALPARSEQGPAGLREDQPAVSKDLKVVIETALEKDRDRRYATADAFAEDLRRVRKFEPIAAKPVGPVGRLVRYVHRRPARAALIAVLALAVPAIAVLLTAYVKDRPKVEAARLMRLEEVKDELLSEASIFLTEGDRRSALATYEQVATMEGGSLEAAAGVAVSHLFLGQPESALHALEAHEGLRDRSAGFQLRAQALRMLGRAGEADALEKTGPPPSSSFDFEILARMGNVAAAMGEEGAASRALVQSMRAILHAPRPRLVHFAARAVAAHLAKDGPAGIDVAAVLGTKWPGVAAAHGHAGLALLSDPATAGMAIAEYRKAIDLKRDMDSWHSNLASALSEIGRVDEAMTEYREALRLNPGRAYAHYNLGNLLRTSGRLDEALAEYREALRLEPAFQKAHYNLGLALQERKLHDEAIAEFKLASRFDPANYSPPYSLALALEDKGLLDEAIEAFREAVRRRPDLALARCKLANVLAERGRFDEAIAEYGEAVRLKQKPVEEHLSRESFGSALFLVGRFDEAIAQYRAAGPLDPACASLAANFGMALSESGQFDEAVIQLRDAVRRRPGVPGMAAKLNRVESQAARVGEIERRLGDGTSPADLADLVFLASIALAKGHSALAARWYQAAFDADPSLADLPPHRFDFVRAAARASAVKAGNPGALDEPARALFLRQAREWLAGDVARVRDPDEDPAVRAAVRRRLEIAKHHVDLASLRGRGIDELPKNEREPWRSLWKSVDEVLAESPR